jgi:DNA-binding transcriptional LysR family regulator
MNKSVMPAPFGELVVAMAEKVLNGVENLHRELDLLSGFKAGNLIISMSPYMHCSLSERFIERLMKDYPEISLDLIHGTWKKRIEMLKKRRLIFQL